MTDTDAIVNDFLEHHGVKGMHWGIRKDHTLSSHKQWKNATKSPEMATKVFQDAMKAFEPHRKEINNLSIFKGKDLNHDPHLASQYDSMMLGQLNRHLADSSAINTVSADGKHIMLYQMDRTGSIMHAQELKRVSHDAMPAEMLPDLKVEFDAMGFIVGLTPMPMKHSDEDPAMGVLAHHGIKGMKWGVRRGRNVQARFSKPVDHQPHPDAQAVSGLRTKPVHALSNAEIKQLNERLNLEQNFKKLNPDVLDRGNREADRILKTVGIGVKTFNYVNSPAGKALGALGGAVILKKVTGGQ